MRVALTRAVPRTIAECELTHLERQPIDHHRAVQQHRQYEAALAALGCRVERLPDAPELPDSVFVEDTAVVLDRLAVITRPGAESRRAETSTMAEALRAYRPLAWIEEPGTLDGGDVLAVGQTIYAGRSARTNDDGIRQLARFGDVRTVDVNGCLHLKTAVTALDASTVLVNPQWIDRASFDGFAVMEVDPTEPFAANVLRVGDVVLCAAAFPRTAERLRQCGLQVQVIEADELAKAEGGLTCCSVILDCAARHPERSEGPGGVGGAQTRPPGSLAHAWDDGRRRPRFRRATSADAAALAEFARRTFIDTFGADNTPEDLELYLARAYGEAQQRAEIDDPSMITIIGESDGAIAAFAQLRWSTPPPCVTDRHAVEIGRFYVDRPWHGRDVARDLMVEAVRTAGGRVWLAVWERNARAIAFYLKSGFRDVGWQPFILGTDLQTDRVMLLSS